MANAGAPQNETRNIMTVEFANNAALKSLFAQKAIGDDCELTVKLTVMNLTPDGATLAVKKITAEDYEGPGEDDVEPDHQSPVMITMRKKKVGKSVGAPARPPQTIAKPTENSQGGISYA